MQILKSIVKGYLYYELREYHSLALHIRDLEKKIKKIKSSFIRTAFKIRLRLMICVIYLYQNKPDKAREYSHLVIKENTFFELSIGRAYYQLAYSYMLDDYHMSSYFFKKAYIYFSKQKNDKSLEEHKINTTFTKLYWESIWEKQEPPNPHNLDEYNTYTSNYIFYHIKIGKPLVAEERLNQINLEKLSGWNLAFYWYYKGLVSNNTDFHYRSVDCFIQLDNYFHRRLPLDELRKLGESEAALNVLSKRGDTVEKYHKESLGK
ncbi:hypothetical protein J2S11_004259 [Bacillus horti]|uniref:Tetratricopeptide repeat protein n=1 Tax=Caldalkalibacillus horti TaxID=77523 RepID=A0ABT9W4Y4_9BACI|nr:AimR family lysis-lysogeny pheromone receptor [Bacillus horti]MDQ0168297.1 hypothetical protein [Bacillus horti]